MRTSGEAVLSTCWLDKVESGPRGPGEAESGPQGPGEAESRALGGRMRRSHCAPVRLGMSLVLINSTSLGILVLDPRQYPRSL